MSYGSKFDKIWNTGFAIGFFVCAIVEFFLAAHGGSIGLLITGIGLLGGGIVLVGRLMMPENISIRLPWLWVTFAVTLLGVIFVFLRA